MALLTYFDRFLKIKEKMIILTMGVVGFCLLVLSVYTIVQYRTFLLNSTTELCKNLSLNISDVSREELVINDIYDNTRASISRLSQRNRDPDQHIPGFLNSYVVYRDGRIVAHTNPQVVGTQIPDSELEDYVQLESIDQRETTLNGSPVLRFVDPIFVHYRGQRLWVGASIFEFSRDELYEPVDTIQRTILLLSLILIVGAVALSFTMSRRLSQPIEQLTKAATDLGDGNLGVQVRVETGDEIGQLARIFNEMSVSLKENDQIKTQQAAMKREFEIAQGIQLSLLPGNSVEGPYTFRGFMRTATEVGGDYYDMIEVRHNRKRYWWFIIGDASGHGLSAGLAMLMTQTALHTVLDLNPNLAPDDVFATVNRILYQNIKKLKQRRYMTATFYRADQTGNFVASGLHLDTLIYRSSKRKIDSQASAGMWLGIEPDIKADLTRARFRMARNDLLFLYTDGLVEAMNSRNELFSEERLTDLLVKFGGGSLEVLEQAIWSALTEFAQGEELHDDITFAMIRKNR
ncbi:MAG: SpoIIE family protein phosphatase [Spirochaetales bacterium]|nr:SpoIIE family protein phosphatase [Leptospiraceae bacterium]MCP5479828.1 SpoIIE family protein phosphatase [Spirochaetales bacterium]MCP5486218.1 SpoIIE family protein phosphatase [Spirochaetales bacterium]